MSRALKGTIYVPKDDGALECVLGGTSEADAKKAVGADVVGSWGDHVWADEDDGKPVVNVDGLDDDGSDEGSGSHRTRRRGAGAE